MSVTTASRPYRLIAHLLRRAGFGGRPSEIEFCVRQGYETTVEVLVHPERYPDDLDDRFIRAFPDNGAVTKRQDPQIWWAYRMLKTNKPLQEKMSLFWHDHFATDYLKVTRIELLWNQYNMLKKHALGDFAEMLKAVSRDPAMILYLDSDNNVKGNPNENYARELMELFSMGEGNGYTEGDVEEVARAFTGWTLDKSRRNFEFKKEQHDFSEKTILGQTGAFDGDEVVDIIANHPATAEYMARKLFLFFVADEPDASVIRQIARSYVDHKRDIRLVLRDMFLSDYFRAERCWHAKIKSPSEYVIGGLRCLGDEASPGTMATAMARLGMELFNPPDVSGWQWGPAWINTSSLIERVNYMGALLAGRDHPELIAALAKLPPAQKKAWPRMMVDQLLLVLGPLEITDTSHAILVQYAEKELARVRSNPAMYVRKLNVLLQLTMGLPEYQLA